MNLITKLDFDGLVCAAMLTQKKPDIKEILFSTAREIETRDILFDINPDDILAHLPYYPGVGTWFSNHDWEHFGTDDLARVDGKWGEACCTAELVKNYFEEGGLEGYDPLIEVAARIECANLNEEDVLAPRSWMLINYTLDPRFPADREYGVHLTEMLRSTMPAEEVLGDAEVAARVAKYKDAESQFVEELKTHSRLEGNVIITDFRDMGIAPRPNRYRVFLEFPEGNVQARIERHPGNPNNLLVSVSKSIFNRTLKKTHLGQMMEQYGGGGVDGAATCAIKDKADLRIKMIIDALRR